MSTDPKPINKPQPVCHICGRPAVAYDQHRRLVCAVHSLHPFAKFNTVGRGQPKVGRNKSCPCGSERKFKVCCGKPVPRTLYPIVAEPTGKRLGEELENVTTGN